MPRELGNREGAPPAPRQARPFEPSRRFRDRQTAPAQPPGKVVATDAGQPAIVLAPVGQRRRRRSVGIVLALIVILFIGGAFSLLDSERAAKKPRSLVPIRPISEIKTRVAGPAASSAVIAHRSGVAFVLAGARFTVSTSAKQAWTAFTRRSSPGSGQRWLLVTIGVRNLTRAAFDPRVLHYRVIGADGLSFFQDLAYGTGPDVHRPAHPVSVNGAVQAELAFRVPTKAARLRLAFDPTGKHQRVVVALG